jgi:SAM-dependent methyltransferase
MPLFRKAAPQDPLIISMTGAALGSRVLIICGDDAELPADVAAKAGMSGQTVALAQTPAAAAFIGARAERRGVLVETGTLDLPLPAEPLAYDLVIADDRPSPAGSRTTPALLAEAFRVLRPGGRIVVLRSAGGRRWFLPAPVEAPPASRALEQDLLRAGFRAAREIAVRNGVRFIEAARSV